MTNAELVEQLRLRGAILQGHFVLPDGSHSDTCIDKFRALEDPGLMGPLAADLGEQLISFHPTHLTGSSTGGMIVASQAALAAGARIYHLEFTQGVTHLDPFAQIAGAQFAVVDDFVSGAQQFDATVRAIRSKGAEVVALGAAVTLPVRLTDLPISSFVAGVLLDARIYSPEHVPTWLRAIPVLTVPDWRSAPP